MAGFSRRMTTPQITVIVGTRNRPELLPRALATIAHQTLANFECLVVDDGSSPAARETCAAVIASLGPRFRFLRDVPADSPGTGPASTRNRGLREARGHFVTFLDDDDWFTAGDHFDVAVDALRTHDADYFFSNREGHRDGHVLVADWYQCCSDLDSGRRLREVPDVFEVSLRQVCRLMRHTYIHPGNLVTTRDLVIKAGGFVDRMFYGEDYEFGLRLADRATRFLYRPGVTTAARLPEGNSVSLSEPEIRQQLSMLLLTQHVRARCRRAETRAAARAREAWTLRELALNPIMVSRAHRVSLAWQSLSLRPTPGALRFLLQQLGGMFGPSLVADSRP
jgi:glycosyltransferase involved in cell wall biosynthesis